MPRIAILVPMLACILTSASAAHGQSLDADQYALELMATMPPHQLASTLSSNADLIAPTLRALGESLMTNDAALRQSIETYLASLVLAHAKSAHPDVRILTIDPRRYVDDAPFRARVDRVLPRMLDESVSLEIREAAASQLSAHVDFKLAETLAVAWKLVPRISDERRIAFDSLRASDDLEPIETSIFSIHSDVVPPEEAKRFFTALRAAAPSRRILVLADAKSERALPAELKLDIVKTFGRPFTVWPRDPFLVTRDAKGAIVLVNRPNLQPGREEDANMVRVIAQSRDVKWSVAPMPFHNGHVLVAPDAAWISIHTVEIRALEILGLKRVPVETFKTATGIRRYVDAVRKAARELESLYGRPVRFVHRLPSKEPLKEQIALMERLGTGGGYDLDSLVTLLPGTALVGDLKLGAKVARDASWKEASAAYGVSADDVQDVPLQAFLDEVSAHLAAQKMNVARLPLLRVQDFLLTWNNVVLEKNQAMGFASLLDAGDAMALEVFEEAGYRLTLLPPLVRSVQLNGGFRCASNHVRIED